MSFSYANPGSGPSAGGIGWFNFGNFTMSPGSSATGLTGTLNDGTTVTFDMSLALVSGTGRTYTAITTPTFPTAEFGVSGYTGIPGNVAINGDISTGLPGGVSAFTLSNIVVVDANSNPVTNYSVIIADAERTSLGEAWNWQTSGGNWGLLATLGANPPTLTGIGTTSATITGNTIGASSSYALTTQSPTNLVLTVTNDFESRQGFAIGFAVTKVNLLKNIGRRIDPADQFVLDVAGTPNAQATTSGAASGLQAQSVEIFAIPGNAYSLNETMAPGSASVLSDYTQIMSAVNDTPNGSVPSIGALPINFTPALGDNVTYTILNAAPQTFDKRVDKDYADLGEVLTYTVTINNPNNYTVTNVVFTDPLPAGTTYIGNLLVNAPYTGTNPATGLTIASIAANAFVTVSWQVQVNTTLPITNPIVNVGNVTVPNGTSGSTNVTSTRVSHADLVATGNFIKTVNKVFASFGETLTYTLTLTNTGNVPANNVVITDPVPAGTTYVPGSITGNVLFTGTPTGFISLIAPIPAGGTATISFQVTLPNGISLNNPVPNAASVKYTYTVNPAQPNGVAATGSSNTVSTQVSAAKLSITKKADKSISYIGDIITYNVAIVNLGNVPASNVVLTDILPNGVNYVPGSLSVSVPYTSTPPSSIQLTNSVAPGETISISFQVKVTAMPNPNPLVNTAQGNYTYTKDPLVPNGVSNVAVSTSVRTAVFRFNFDQQVSDLIQSIALEEAALAAITNAEGAKIQQIIAMNSATTEELLCLNKSVADMTESISLLESILKQKLNAVSCQINGSCS